MECGQEVGREVGGRRGEWEVNASDARCVFLPSTEVRHHSASIVFSFMQQFIILHTRHTPPRTQRGSQIKSAWNTILLYSYSSHLQSLASTYLMSPLCACNFSVSGIRFAESRWRVQPHLRFGRREPTTSFVSATLMRRRVPS